MVTARNQPWGEDEPCFVISVAARMIQVHTQTLRYYEREACWSRPVHGATSACTLSETSKS